MLWGINHIHPFINGNGRTARAACYFVLCVKAGKLLRGTQILPELLREPDVRPRYVEALKEADNADIGPLVELITNQLVRQATGAGLSEGL